MTTVPLSNDRPEASLFSDGLGDRVVAADGATGELLQILRIRPTLTAVPSFEFALRERTARLANFRHAYYARVRRIDRVQAPATGLAIVSDHVEGTRLSDILRVAHERQLQLDINAALCLIRQLVPAIALLHENARDVAHGLISPERLVVTPHARLVILEHVLGSAVEQLQFGRDRLWQEFRIAMPPSAGLPRFDHRADVTGMGLVALALILGRPLQADEFPHRIPMLVHEARERNPLGEEQPLSLALRDWLSRTLQLDVRRAFASAPEALAALEEIVADDSMYVAAPVALETFLSRYIAALLEPPPIEKSPAVAVPQDPVEQTAATPLPDVAPSIASTQEPGGHASPLAAPAAQRAGVQPWPAEQPGAGIPPAATTSAGAAAPVVQPPVWPEPARSSAPPNPAASAFVQAPEITELIPAADLPGPRSTVPPPDKPLFDPAEPFTVPIAEMPQQAPAKKKKARNPSFLRTAAILAGVLALAGAGLFAMRFIGTGEAPSVAMGTLIVQSNPAGVQVFVDGVDRGQTPARLSVTPGAHILELRGRGVPRVIPLTVAAGAQVSQYLEFANTPETGQLAVQSQPAGAKVVVDGIERGVAPLTVPDLTPGDHEVLLVTDGGSVRHIVSVQAGGTASLVAPVAEATAAAGPVSGWVSIKAPFSLEIREGGRMLGTSEADRVMMAAGKHEIQLVNEALGYSASHTVQVLPGKVATLNVELPNGVVHLNASPWAEVWIDGARVGETPIGNLSVPIGPHEVVFRHPQFGEKRHAVSVTLAGPVRLSVDMK